MSETDPTPQDAPPPDSAPQEPPERPRRLEKALGAAATVLRHRELLMQALELLRSARAVTPRQESELLAAYEAGTETVRREVNLLVERLQAANLGEIAVTLRERPELLREQGQLLARDVRAEVDRFLRDQQPTVDAVARAGQELATTGRELARSLKGLGKEAAEHLIRRGREVIREADTGDYEQAAFDWAAHNVPRLERRLVRVLVISGILLVTTGVLVAFRDVPTVRTAAFFLLVALLLYLGFVLLVWAGTLNRRAKEARVQLDRLAGMTPTERRDHFRAKLRRRQPATAGASVDTPTDDAMRAEPGAGHPHDVL